MYIALYVPKRSFPSRLRVFIIYGITHGTIRLCQHWTTEDSPSGSKYAKAIFYNSPGSAEAIVKIALSSEIKMSLSTKNSNKCLPNKRSPKGEYKLYNHMIASSFCHTWKVSPWIWPHIFPQWNASSPTMTYGSGCNELPNHHNYKAKTNKQTKTREKKDNFL